MRDKHTVEGKIRCIFPCYQGISPEKGSHKTALSAINPKRMETM